MQVVGFRVVDELRLAPCNVDDALNNCVEYDVCYFLHVEGFDSGELENWLDQFDLSEFAKRRVVRMGQFTKVIAAKDALIVELRVLGQDSSAAPSQAVYVCYRNLVISFSRDGIGDLDDFATNLTRLPIAKHSTTAVLTAVLLMQVNQFSDEVHRIRNLIFSLDKKMDQTPHLLTFDELLEAKDQLLKLLAVAEEQTACVESVTSLQSEMLDFEGVQGSRSLLLAGAPANERMAARLEKRVSDLRERYDTIQQEKTNRRLAVLTVLSAVFLPLSLVAGIWGMNFAFMPELQHRWSYPIALSFMATLAIAMLYLFRRRGWFD